MNGISTPSRIPSNPESPSLRRLDRLFREALHQRVFSGAALLISSRSRILLERWWGKTRDDGQIIDAHTHFDLASLTKPLFTAPLAMLSIGAGKLGLDDTLHRFFPKAGIPRDKAGITVRHLLNHSSGLPAYKPFYLELLGSPAVRVQDTLLRWILETPTLHLPGAASMYSDLGFMLLGIILEMVWDRSLDRLLDEMLQTFPPAREPEREEVFPVGRGTEPPAAEDAGFVPLQIHPDPILPPVISVKKTVSFAATEFCPWRRRLLEGEVHDENAYCLGGVGAHAGLFGTARAVFRILDFLWNVHEGTFSAAPWFSEVVREFWERKGKVPHGTWALGFDTPTPGQSSAGGRFGPRSIGHLGFTGTSFWMDPDRGILVILLSNRVYPSRQNDKIRAFRPILHDTAVEVYEELRRP
ncbi:MAG: beta-lactamase family protein [Syntrophobacteraceae bacterium]|nr:beta-lactamase family protein [Syntrophobacteraceae bacterium]